MIRNLYNSCPAKVKFNYPTQDFRRNTRINQKADLIVFAGIIRGEGNIFKWCRENNKRFLYLDHAYINRGYDFDVKYPEKEWMRITDSAFCWDRWEDRPSDRWNKFFEETHGPLKPWLGNKEAQNVLILPPSLATQYLFPDSTEWLNKTIRLIKRNTDRPFVVREKPLQPLLNTNNDVIDIVKHDNKPLDEDLDNAYCLITYNSAVAVQSIIRGIPTISYRTGCANHMSFNITEIDNPPEPPRQAWLNQLVYHQFTTAEMIDGSVWQMLGISNENS